MTEYVISDTHFFHQKIIQYCNRPFSNVWDMNQEMIGKWNNRVRPEDLVYHLGDVGLMKTAVLGELKSIVTSLNGKKILILGNHDKSAGVMRELGFDVVCDAMVVRVPNMDRYVCLNHRPLPVQPWTGRPDFKLCDYVVHGHIHNSTVEQRRTLHPGKGELVEIGDFNINVSVEVINYDPQPLESVVKQHERKLRS